MNRRRLPNRRPCITWDYKYSGSRCHATMGFYDRECKEPGELFTNVGKAGTDLRAVTDEASIGCSVAMQYGADVKTLHHAMPRLEDGTPAGPIGQALDGFVKGGQG